MNVLPKPDDITQLDNLLELHDCAERRWLQLRDPAALPVMLRCQELLRAIWEKP